MAAVSQIERIFHEEHGRGLSARIRQFEGFTLAEDVLVFQQKPSHRLVERFVGIVLELLYQHRLSSVRGAGLAAGDGVAVDRVAAVLFL
jgi:hypothetical protein